MLTTVKNIWDTYYGEAIVYLPPDVHSIEELEGVLHNQTAIGDFYEYLEALYQENLMQPTEDNKASEIANNNRTIEDEEARQYHINNFRLLSLYIDIRCYDNEIRKIQEKQIEKGGESRKSSISQNLGESNKEQ